MGERYEEKRETRWSQRKISRPIRFALWLTKSSRDSSLRSVLLSTSDCSGIWTGSWERWNEHSRILSIIRLACSRLSYSVITRCKDNRCTSSAQCHNLITNFSGISDWNLKRRKGKMEWVARKVEKKKRRDRVSEWREKSAREKSLSPLIDQLNFRSKHSQSVHRLRRMLWWQQKESWDLIDR